MFFLFESKIIIISTHLDKWNLMLIAESLNEFLVGSLVAVLSQDAKHSLPPKVK